MPASQLYGFYSPYLTTSATHGTRAWPGSVSNRRILWLGRVAFTFQAPRARKVTERLFGKFALRTSVIPGISRYCLEAETMGTGENTRD